MREWKARMNQKLSQLSSRMGGLEVEAVETSQKGGQRKNHDRNYIRTKYYRLDFPSFDGTNPSGWIYRCERFFNYNQVEENDMVYIASIHLDGQALIGLAKLQEETTAMTVKKPQLFLIEGEDSEEDSISMIENQQESASEPNEAPLISFNTMSGSAAYHTMRVRVTIKKQLISILTDSRSTDNFLDPGIVKQTGVLVQQTNLLMVTVADGSRIASTAVCKQLEWFMQGTLVKVDFKVLPLGGCNVVLGV